MTSHFKKTVEDEEHVMFHYPESVILSPHFQHKAEELRLGNVYQTYNDHVMCVAKNLT